MKLKSVGLGIFSALTFLFMIGTVSAKEVSINSAMSQDEINAAVSNGDVVTVQSGDYATQSEDGRNYHKYILADGTQITVNLSGNYERLQLITRNNGTIHVVVNGNTTLNGEASEVFNPAAALAIQSGLIDIATNGSTLTITNYNNGIRLGNNIAATQTQSASLTLLANAKVVVTESNNLVGVTKDTAYYDSYNDFGDPGVAYGWRDAGNFVQEGNRGSGIYTRGKGATHYITLESNSSLVSGNNDGTGIYVGYASWGVDNHVYITLKEAELTGDNNGGVGLFEDGGTDYNSYGNYYLTATNSDISFSNNGSNGMTGHHNSEITLTNSTMHVDNNGAIGINNGYVILNNSTLTGNENGSHGITNIALDATDSTVETSKNAYIGLNITKYNTEQTSTNIVNSKLTAKENGGSGIRFHAVISVDGAYEGTANISDSSVITALNNGIGTSIYGYAVKPGDSSYWADIVASGDVNATESSIFCGTYSLYNRGGYSLPSILYVNKDMIMTVDKNDEFVNAMDIFNDPASTAVGRTYVISGSLQGNLFDMTNGTSYELNGVALVGDIYAAPVNADGTKLIRFDLNQEINVEVNSDGTNTFTYYDPYTGKEYVYQFRYNELGEDLIESESNNAYIWTPASIVHYDATEGVLDYTGSTAGEIVNGSSVTDKTNNGDNDRYTSDITVFGNSLDLAEKVMPNAVKEGYVFLGWFVPTYENMELAKEYAEAGNFEALYELLVIPFTSGTKVLSDFNDPTTGLQEITIYAKWAKIGDVVAKIGDVVSHYVDEDGNPLADDIILSGTVGSEYKTEALEIEGYTLKTVIGNTTGTYIDGTIEVTYVYEFTSGIGDGGDIPSEPSEPGEILPPQTGIEVVTTNDNNHMLVYVIAILNFVFYATCQVKKYKEN